MNLGIIIPSLEKYGGAERFVIECVRQWQQRHDITIYATAFNERLLREHDIGRSVRLIRLTPQLAGEHAFVINAAVLPKLWRQEIGRHDVYHAHLWPTHLLDLHPMVWFPHEPLRLLHDLRFEQRFGQGIAEQPSYEIHTYPKYNYEQIGGNLYDAYLAAVDAIDKTVVPEVTVANSRHTAAYLRRIYGRDITHIVYPGVDIESPIDLKVDPKLFVTISQLWAHKRVHILIEAIALTDETQLIVVGSGPELERLEALCIKLGVENRVFFLSDLNNFELQLVLARACAFLFSPIKEPFGIVVLEAMAAGKPIVAVDEGGYVEVCHPDYAWLIPPSPLVFAEKIQQLRDDPERARAMGEAARKAVVPYAWTRTADELEIILANAVAENGAAHPVQQPPPRSRTLVGIQYYLWYGDGFGAAHWNDDMRSGHVGDHPFLGFYSSEKGQTIEHHLDQFEAMKLDYVILNLHLDATGLNPIEARGIQHVFEIASRRGSPLRFAIQLSPYSQDIDAITSAVAGIERLYAARDEYFQLDGKPVLFWFWSSAHDGNGALFEAMHSAAAGFRNLALSLRQARGLDEARTTFQFFEGFAPYSPLELASEDNWTRIWQGAYDASAVAGMAYRLLTVSPGYDDHGLTDPLRQGNPFRVVPRRDGDTYARSLAFAASMSPPPDLITISTYNEYHENTHIEASSRNGDRYVRMTRDFVDLIHATALTKDAANG